MFDFLLTTGHRRRIKHRMTYHHFFLVNRDFTASIYFHGELQGVNVPQFLAVRRANLKRTRMCQPGYFSQGGKGLERVFGKATTARIHSGSAINFAEGLRGNLLIVHGSGDDNVHLQGTELLVNRLIELGKQFDFMVYPGRTHSISEGPGTTLHVYTLLARYLQEHLPAGPR